MMLATSVIGLVFILLFLGLIAWAVYRYAAGVPAFFKNLIFIVLAIIAVFIVLQAFGVLGEVRGVQVPRL